jgi:MFS family permease
VSTYHWFTAGVASWFTAWGMNALIFSWLVVGVLQAEAQWVGVAQSSIMLPSLFLLLFGGAVADRFDPRRLLVGLHLCAALPVLGLAALVGMGALSLALVLGYGVLLGTFSAFVMPSRDAMLSRVAGDDMMRAVTGMTIFQFGGQAAGSLLAGSAESLGLVPVLVLQAVILGLGGLATLGVAEGPPRPDHAGQEPALVRIREGIAIVARTPNLRMPVVLVFGVGVLFIGPYMVLFPLLVRDHYAGGALELAFVLMTFPLGTIAGSIALRARGGIRRKGQALLLALASGGLTLVVIGIGLPFWGLVAAALFWGLAGAVFINTSRTLVQEAAPSEARGRVLSAYQVGFVGGGPLGALLSGFVAERVGALTTLTGAGMVMLGCISSAAIFTNARKMQ